MPSFASSRPCLHEPRARQLEAAVVAAAHEPDLQRAVQQREVGRPPLLGELEQVDRARLLVGAERPRERVLEAQHLLARSARAVEQAADEVEVEAVGLQLLDELQPRDVVGAVVARAPAHLGRGQQPARLVRADVAHGHPDPPRELVDRQLLVFGHGLIVERSPGTLTPVWRIDTAHREESDCHMSPVVPHFELSEEDSASGTHVINVRGEIHVQTAPRFSQRLSEAIDSGNTAIVLDLSAVEFIDSTGLSVLLNGLRRVTQRRGGWRSSARTRRSCGCFRSRASTRRSTSSPSAPPAFAHVQRQPAGGSSAGAP